MNQNIHKIINSRYVLQEVIHPGGMTTVYKGYDIMANTQVAIKRFDRDVNLPNIDKEAFEREVEALKTLTHPNIIRILDSGEDSEGKLFIVLELMDHDLLKEKERVGPAFEGWDSFTELIILPLLDALAYAHEKAIAHRDVKPANILVATDGTIKLADFGISKLKRTLKPRETLRTFMSPPFSSPEIDDGSHTYSRDVFSIGVLYLWGMSDVPPTDYKDINRSLQGLNAHPDLIRVISKSLSDPSERQQSAAVLAAEIEQIHNKRQHTWESKDRSRSYLVLTENALEAIRYEKENLSDSDIRKLIYQDINMDSCIQRFVDKPGTVDQKIIAGNYLILGDENRYQIAEDKKGSGGLVLLNVFSPKDMHFHVRDRRKFCR